MSKKVFLFSVLVFFAGSTFAQTARSLWVDSVFSKLDLNAKVGQLFMIPVSSAIDAEHIHEISSLIKSHEVGGLIFTDIGPGRQASLINHFQAVSNVPLLIAQQSDMSALLDSAIVYPPPVMLGAIGNDTLLYRLGSVMARQLKMLGINLVFNPDTRIASPVPNRTSSLSFSQDNFVVTRKSLALMRGLQDNGVISCAKYYSIRPIPLRDGKDVPQVNLSGLADTIQRMPYATLIAHGLKGITPEQGALSMPYEASASIKKLPYSQETLTALYSGELLRKKLDFHGLTFIDLSKLDRSAEKQKEGDAEVFAFQTGNDVLMNPADVGTAIRRIKRLIKKDPSYEQQLDNSVRKILEAKFEAGLWKRDLILTDNLLRRLNNPQARVLNKKLYAAGVTVLSNKENVLPVHILENKRFAYISSTKSPADYAFYEHLKKYTATEFIAMDGQRDDERLRDAVQQNQVIIVGVFPETPLKTLERLDQLATSLPSRPQIIYCDFGHSSFLASAHRNATVLTAYTNAGEAVEAVPQIVFGALPASGTLPVRVSEKFDVGTGERTPTLGRLAYSLPEDTRMDSRVLLGIDSIAAEAIRMGATPGCQVLVARNGKVIYEKSFGHLTYQKNLPVTSETIYDLASITKVAATLQAAMFMHERGIIDLNKKVSHYLPELRKTNKKDITFVDMLTHQAGLLPFLQMYPQTMKDTMYLPEYYSRIRNEKYPLRVSTNLYGSSALRDSIWSWVVRSNMTEKPARTPYSYKYSDFGFLILQRVAETLLNQPLDEFTQQNFYDPLGASTMGFNPLDRFPKHIIAPTEDDKIYRRTFVSGTVHDERAAMMGGVAGHAGLFGTAGDLAKLGQMLLQDGYYGGNQYYKPETVRLFTSKTYRTSRRGIGWDKPLQSDTNGPTSIFASPSTFGHTGFTGTCIWVDPQFNLVYIFLSNRVYPDRNSKLINANIRSRIQDVIYKSIFNYVDQQEAPYIVNDFAINAGPARPLK